MPRSKAEDAARKRIERTTNPEAVRARSRARYVRKQVEILEQRRLERVRNPERISAEKRRHYVKHRETIVAKVKAYTIANGDAVRARSRAYYAANRGLYRLANIRRKYGLSAEEYAAMLERHGHSCAVCKGKPRGRKSLCVDHDHETGRVRGLLCDHCNRAIGLLGDSLATVQSAATYLQEHKGSGEL